MIVSHKWRFIFVHCRKVAGSSMKVALASALGQDDIIIGSLNEIIESGIGINKATKRTLIKPKAIVSASLALLVGRSWSESVNIGVKSYYRNRLSLNPPHPTAKEASKYFAYEWKNYFRFAFVRNPYERVVSDYLWRMRITGSKISFLDYLNLLASKNHMTGIIHPMATNNFEMISIDGSIDIDFVGRYEKLEEDFLTVTDRIGLRNLRLGHRQKVNPQKEDYGVFYGKQEIEVVSELFSDEISAFGYNYPY